MKHIAQSLIKTGLMVAMINETPVKLVIDGHIDPHFGHVVDMTNTHVIVEHFDYAQTVALDDLTNLYS